MKAKQILCVCICVTTIVSCKKDKKDDVTTPITTIDAADYFKLAPGNYWVYDTYLVDTGGVETLVRHDDTLARVANDTVINGFIYHSFSYAFVPGVAGGGGWIRSTGNNMVTSEGKIIFSTDNFVDTLARDTAINSSSLLVCSASKMEDKDAMITVPAGTFKTSDYRTYVWEIPAPVPFSNPRFSDSRYSKGIGLVEYSYFYLSVWTEHLEVRLKSYHVQ